MIIEQPTRRCALGGIQCVVSVVPIVAAHCFPARWVGYSVSLFSPLESLETRVITQRIQIGVPFHPIPMSESRLDRSFKTLNGASGISLESVQAGHIVLNSGILGVNGNGASCPSQSGLAFTQATE